MNQAVTSTVPASPVGLHRVLEPSGTAITLPQAARRLDARRELWPSEVRIAIDTLNLDAASYRQLAEKHRGEDGAVDGDAVREEVLSIVRAGDVALLGVDATETRLATEAAMRRRWATFPRRRSRVPALSWPRACSWVAAPGVASRPRSGSGCSACSS